MSRLEAPSYDEADLIYQLQEDIRKIVEQVNGMAENRARFYTSSETIPGWVGQPDEVVMKLNKTKVGTSPNKYIVTGWQYVGGAWEEMQIRTGN